MFRPQYKYKRTFIGSLPSGVDLYDVLTKIVTEEDIRTGNIKAIGAVTSAIIGFFDQNKKEYLNIEIKGGFEILSCIGNVSVRDCKPFVHAHITLSDKDGKVFGGHLMPGTKVFACEVFIDEFTGEDLVRERDEETDLFLWKNKNLI
ncbi:MAG: DNA-binding protein [Bacteroidota bacterium]|nr:DNA-binding protein [Bacteroidota bacterium]